MVRRMLAPWWRLGVPVRVLVVIVLIVAAAAGTISWDAQCWVAGELGVDSGLRWLYPVVIDGSLVGATVGVLAVTARPERAWMWFLLGAGLAASMIGNGAHAPADGWDIIGPLTLHRLGSALPALGLFAMLHTLVLVVRASAPAPRRATARPERVPRTARAGARSKVVVLPDGRTVSEGHARKLRARERAGSLSTLQPREVGA